MHASEEAWTLTSVYTGRRLLGLMRCAELHWAGSTRSWLSCLTLRLQARTEEELVAALQEAEKQPDACARPACTLVMHMHVC